MRIIIDLDGVICKIKRPKESYYKLKPNYEVIKILKKWKKEGHQIIIYTARQMRTYCGDVNLVKKNIAEETELWLKKNNVPYDEIYYGKPYGDIYVDDLSLKFKALDDIDSALEKLKYTLIITMAGRGKRFLEAGISLPKYMIEVKSKTLFEWALNSLPLDLVKNIIFVCLREHQEKFSVNSFIKEKFSNFVNMNCSYEIFNLSDLTEGQAHTVAITIKEFNLKNPLMIFNIDSTFSSSRIKSNLINCINRNYDGLIGGVELNKEQLNEGLCYVKVDENHRLKKIEEKKIISNIASTGLYTFTRPSDFISGFEYIQKNDIRVNGEFYISLIYKHLLSQKKKFIVDFAEEFYSLGTPKELKNFEKL